MNSWWVNHKQTAKQELAGGYIWSPHTNKDGSFNQTYLNLSQMAIGDIVFSYADGIIRAVGIVMAAAIDTQKPIEFGAAGAGWNNLGYLVKVDFSLLSTPFSPKEYINEIAPFLPEKYSPIRQNGYGNQKCYLASISHRLCYRLLDLIGSEGFKLLDEIGSDDDELQRGMTIPNHRLTSTEKQQLILSRRGQGIFRKNVSNVEKSCRISGVADQRLLIASHIKPWRLSNNDERLDGNNGFLLAPHVDHLFDKGFMSFSDDGTVLTSDDIAPNVLAMWQIVAAINVGRFNVEQKGYLTFHRDNIFRR
jgi:hypothetical protein